MNLADILPIPAHWATAVLVVEYLIKIVALGTVPENRNPSSSQAWLLAILLIPVIGVPLFLMIGSPYVTGKRNRIQEEANALYAEELRGWPTIPEGVHENPVFSSTLEMNRRLTSMPCMTGEFVALRSDYAESIAAITAAVDGATDHVHVEVYAQSLDEETEAFYDALLRAADRGVAVRVLADQIGSAKYKGFRRLRRRMRGTGVRVELMLPVNPFAGRFRRPDLRNHRKLITIDGRVGFVGSQNMISRYYGKKSNERVGRAWHDAMMEVRGEIVDALNGIFAVDWYAETDEVLQVLEDLVDYEYAEVGGDVNVFQLVPSGPGFRTEPGMRMYAELAAQATSTLRIVSPYFVPDTGLLNAITSASYRGVDVELYVPEKADQFVVDHAQRSYFRALLEAGVRIFRYPTPQVLHTKTMVMDGTVGVIGSSNMDMRSFQLNFELSMLTFGGDAVPALSSLIDGYQEQSGELDLAEWNSRPWPGRYIDNVAKLTSALQ